MLKKVPHTFVIVFSIIIICAIITWIIPGGEFERQKIRVGDSDREVVVNNSFHYIDSQPQTWQIFASLYRGFVKSSHIIIFILMIGGAFWIMNISKSLDVGIYSFLKFLNKLQHFRVFKFLGVNNIVITLSMLLFSVFGAVFGMSEETIAFVIIFIPLAISMGYDSITGVAMCYVGAHVGFAGALLNPFTIGIAQGIAQIPLFSGIEYRFFCWIILNIVAIWFVLRYAKKVKLNPAYSPVYEVDAYWREKKETNVENIKYYTSKSSWIVYGIILFVLVIFSYYYNSTTLKIGLSSFTFSVIPLITVLYAVFGFFANRKSVHFFILTLLLLTVIFLIVGVMGYNWYVMEIASLFLAMGIAAGISIGSTANELVKYFLDGSKDILSAALIVGLAGGIVVILEDGKVIDTILFSISRSMENLNQIATVSVMYVIQTIINIFMPSGSAKAALTMPIMSQFSDLIGLSRQATVMAYQFGDGFTNMITPTSGVLIGVLGVARIPFEKWIKWILPFMTILILLGFLLLIPTVTMKLNGF